MTTIAPVQVTGPWSMLNNKAMQHHNMQANYVDQNAAHHYSLMKPDPIMERSASPHGSEHSHYSGSHLSRSYHSPGPMHNPMPMSTTSMPTGFAGFPDMSTGMPQQQQHVQPAPQHLPPPLPQPQDRSQDMQAGAKTNPCSTCGKGFARRSDLARHERIHTGVRPHVCDYADCGKMFIQRSALTVHKRTHTGEKPHRCEICAARFSDSSSLARHRRTHWGQRPYKCPYANCQKTFTRRTTLNRHQNGHRGTIEEAAAATAAALAASGAKATSQARSEGDHLSSHGSPMTTPSPGQRTMSMSPTVDLAGAGAAMGRHGPGDMQYLQNGPLPMHLRVGSPVSASGAAAAAVAAGYGPSPMRPTSHPTGYGPPPPSTLEPSLEAQQQQQQSQSGPNSVSGSPHMSTVGWQSPAHMASPSSHNGSSTAAAAAAAAATMAGGYVYADAGDSYQPAGHQMSHMFYGSAPAPQHHQHHQHHQQAQQAQQAQHQQQMRRQHQQSPEPGLIHMA